MTFCALIFPPRPPPLFAPTPLQLIKRAQIGKKWTENASERVNFSKFSYPSGLVALDTTTFKISPPPF